MIEIIEVGDIGKTKYGCQYKAIKILGNQKVLIEFQDEHKHASEVYATNFKNGNVWNPYQITLFGVGCVGDGPFLTKENGSQTSNYCTWRDILQRCYCPEYQQKHPSYIGCSVSNEWHNFQTFAKWRTDNWYSIPGERMQIDKDILLKGNKMYCPELCCIIPQRINLIFPAKKSYRNGTPPGVQKLENGKFMATCGIHHKNTESLGTFDTVEEAFIAYKLRKEKNIRDVADQYKRWIPTVVYNALCSWNIEMTD